jgi:hypothetical protein
MRLTKEDSLLNPCPPFFRNEEVSEDVIASDYFVGYAFKKNLIYVQQAIILYLLWTALTVTNCSWCCVYAVDMMVASCIFIMPFGHFVLDRMLRS